MQPEINPYYIRQQYPNYQQMLYGLAGKVVNDFSEITASDVPLDGRSAVFMKRDLSEIDVRAWTPQGTISNVVFKPMAMENTPNEENSLKSLIEGLQTDIRNLTSKLNGKKAEKNGE